MFKKGETSLLILTGLVAIVAVVGIVGIVSFLGNGVTGAVPGKSAAVRGDIPGTHPIHRFNIGGVPPGFTTCSKALNKKTQIVVVDCDAVPGKTKTGWSCVPCDKGGLTE